EPAPEARRYAASEQAQPLVGEVRLDRKHLVGGDVHDLRVAADIAGGADRLPVVAVRDVRPDPGPIEGLRALIGPADRAVETDSALGSAGDDRALPDLD